VERLAAQTPTRTPGVSLDKVRRARLDPREPWPTPSELRRTTASPSLRVLHDGAQASTPTAVVVEVHGIRVDCDGLRT
jgi:hypothetical protein